MIALKIIDIKEFMNKLLIKDTFDQYELVESSITTFCTFSINGKYQKDFFDSEIKKSLEENNCEYTLWRDIRPYCFSIIRGKRTPLQFKFVFQLSAREKEILLQNSGSPFPSESIGGLFLNIQFKNNELFCTTGIGYQTFLPDVSFKQVWDTFVIDFFKKQSISFEQL